MKFLKDDEMYLLFFYDDDARTFNVRGPVFEGDNCDDRTCALQQTGRNVRISVSVVKAESGLIHPENYIHRGPKGFRFDPYLFW